MQWLARGEIQTQKTGVSVITEHKCQDIKISTYVDTNIENWEVKLEEREGGLVADRRLGTGCCWRHWRPAVLVELVQWWWSWCTVELELVRRAPLAHFPPASTCFCPDLLFVTFSRVKQNLQNSQLTTWSG